MRLRIVVLLLTAAVAGGCGGQPAALTEEDVTAIRENSAAFSAARMAKDMDALATMYTADVVVMPPNEPAIDGASAMQARWADAPAPTEHRLTIHDITGRGDLAYVRGTYVVTGAGGGGRPVTDRGKYVEIRRKQPDGRWLIAVDIWNSDLAPAPVE